MDVGLSCISQIAKVTGKGATWLYFLCKEIKLFLLCKEKKKKETEKGCCYLKKILKWWEDHSNLFQVPGSNSENHVKYTKQCAASSSIEVDPDTRASHLVWNWIFGCTKSQMFSEYQRKRQPNDNILVPWMFHYSIFSKSYVQVARAKILQVLVFQVIW